jgi:DNA polymerase I-like protein with 3'-5' exonuclease and polymerase domains
MQPELDDGYWITYRDLTMKKFPMLMYMMVHGIRVNRERLQKIKEETGGLDGNSGRIGELKARLREVAEWDFNPGSPKQCIQYFYGTKGVKPYVSRKTGQPTVDDKALAAIFKRYRFPEAKIAQEIRSVTKSFSNYLDMSFDPDGYFRFSINPRGAVSGRYSTSSTIRGTGHNVQNIPDEFRDFMEADDA